MGQRKESRRLGRPLPKRRQVQAEALADAALGVFNLGVDLVGGKVDELQREIGDQRLESQACFEFLAHATRLLPSLPELDDVAIILAVGDHQSVRSLAHATPGRHVPDDAGLIRVLKRVALSSVRAQITCAISKCRTDWQSVLRELNLVLADALVRKVRLLIRTLIIRVPRGAGILS